MALTEEEFYEIIFGERDFLVELKDKTPRTLLYGYGFNRESAHVYLDDKGQINLYIYTLDSAISHKVYTKLRKSELLELIPLKRIYPESADAEFLSKLFSIYSTRLNFTTYSKERFSRVKDLQFHGEIFIELDKE